MSANADLASLLTQTVHLDSPPVAMRFVGQPPADLPRFSGEVPSACTFWRRAEHGAFYADAPAHMNCLVGVHTMGLPMPEEKGPELMALIGQMGQNEYLDGQEVAHIPTVPGAKTGIVYGPLAAFDETPDAVLAWVTPYQSMLLQEATGAATWTANPGIPTFGRPSCAAIPAAVGAGIATQSLGCMGMRVFTEVAQDRLLAVLPKQLLERLPEALNRVADANDKMAQHYRGQKALHSKGQVEARV